MVLENEILAVFSSIKILSTQSYDVNRTVTHSFTGKVETEFQKENVIIFNEFIRWENKNSTLIKSRNVYQWTFLDNGNIVIEHLRFGKDKPFFLVEILPIGENFWRSIEPHNCNNDLYSAELRLKSDVIVLNWTIKGATENYSLEIRYSS